MTQLEERDLRLQAFERNLAEDTRGAADTPSDVQEANRKLRASLEAVRVGLSAILIDGRGAVVAHDLVAILHQLEEVL